MFVLNHDHVLGICDRLIDRSYDLNIWAYARVDTIKPKFLSKLKRAGINWLCLGIESASDYVRDGASKNYSNNDLRNIVKNIQDSGIYVIGNFIFGLPDDSLDRMGETLELALELNCEFANFYSAMAYPGSQLYPLAQKNKWQLPDDKGGPGWIGYSQHSYDILPDPSDPYLSKASFFFNFF